MEIKFKDYLTASLQAGRNELSDCRKRIVHSEVTEEINESLCQKESMIYAMELILKEL